MSTEPRRSSARGDKRDRAWRPGADPAPAAADESRRQRGRCHGIARAREVFAADSTEVLDELIERAINATGRSVALMSRDGKTAVLRFLDRKGTLFANRAVGRVARRFNISRVTAYDYLDQVRSGQP